MPDGAPRDRLVVGQVRGLHGLNGAVRVEILTDDPDRFSVGSRLHREGSDAALTVAWSQQDGPGILVRFREVPSRPAAEPLREAYLEAEVGERALADGEFYWHEVVGVSVTTSNGETLGTVRDVFRAGGGEILVVDGGRWGEILVPAVGAVVSELAPREGRIVVDRDALGLDAEPIAPRPRGRRTTRALRGQRDDVKP